MEKRVKELNTGYEDREQFRQLLYCTCVRYIRKAALDTPVILSDTETERVLHRIIDPQNEKETVGDS